MSGAGAAFGICLFEEGKVTHNHKETSSHVRRPGLRGTHLRTCSGSYLHNRVSSCRGLHRPPAPLRLVVGPVVRFGLHVDVQLVLVGASGHRPLQRREGGHGDAADREGTQRTM